MSKMKQLDAVLAEITGNLDNLNTAISELRKMFTAPTEPPKPSVTFEQLRAVLAEKSRQGFTADVRKIITNHGADKLSGIDPAEYASVLAEAEVLGNAE